MKPFGSMAKAMECGHIKPLEVHPVTFDWRLPHVGRLQKKILTRIPRSPKVFPLKPETQWLDPARDTRAQLYQDEGFRWKLDHGASNGNVYEIARFFSGIDGVGVIKYVGTWAQIIDPDSGDPVELDFSNPFTMQDNGVEAEFLLRLDQGTQDNQLVFPDAPFSGTLADVTGYGYNRLPSWNDYRFYWGRYANNVFWLVPRRHAIRLYIHVISGGSELTGILGRLQGYTQPAGTLPAAYNISHAW